MTTEQQLTEAQVTEQEAKAEAEYEAGFSGTDVTTPVPEIKPESTVDVTSVTEAPTEAAKVEAAAVEVGKATALFAGMNEQQIKEVLDQVPGLKSHLDQELRKVYGKFGEVQKNMQSMQQPTRKFDAAALKRLSDPDSGFPEIAELLAQDLSEFLSTPAAKAAEEEKKPEPVDVESRINAAVAQVTEKTEHRLLTVLHPDWQSVAKNPEFAKFEKDANGKKKLVGGWISTLPPEEQKKYLESNDAFVTAEAFTKFKAFKPTKPDADKNKRLQSAITPTGDGAPANTLIDDEAAFAAGWKSVTGG